MRAMLPIARNILGQERSLVFLTGLVVLAPFACLLIPDNRVLVPDESVIPCSSFSDYATYQLPVREYARKELREGRFPSWIPNLGCGLPLHAGQQAAICYPFITPFVLVLGVCYGSKVSIFLHFSLCFIGQYLLGRRFGLSRGGASFSGAAATLGAFPIAHIMEGHLNLLFAYAWAPWFFSALMSHLGSPGIRSSSLLAGLATLLLLTGHPQLPYYIFLCGFVWLLGSLAHGKARLHRLRCTTLLLVAAGVTSLLCAIQWLPTAELLAGGQVSTERGTVAYADQFRLRPSDLLLYLWPQVKGNALLGIPEFRTFDCFHERSAYLGLLPLVLALVALVDGTKPRWALPFAGWIAMCLTMALGRHTFLFPALVSAIPGLSAFRCPGRMLGAASFLIALLAGRGADSLARGFVPPSRRQLLLVGTVLIPITVIYLGALLQEMDVCALEEHVSFAQRNLGPWMIGLMVNVMVGIGALVVCILNTRARIWCYAILLVALIGDVAWNNAAVLRLGTAAAEPTPGELPSRDVLMRFFDRSDAASVMYQCRYSKSIDMTIREHLALIGTNEGGVLPAATERLFQAIETNSEAALAVSGCRYTYDRLTDLWTPVEGCLPRVRYFPQGSGGMVDIPLDRIGRDELDRMRGCIGATQHGICLVAENSQEIHIKVHEYSAGTLVLADTFYPGWKCMVDGSEVPIFPAHDVFRAVRVPAGAHDVVFRFRPRTLWTGALLALLGDTVLAAMGLVSAWSGLRMWWIRRRTMGKAPQGKRIPACVNYSRPLDFDN